MHPHLPQGIRVEEGTNQQPPIEGVEIRPTAFLGACQRGPLDTPTLVGNFSEFVQIFGALTDDYPLTHAVELFFSNGGQSALVVRIARNARPACIDLPCDNGSLRLWSYHKGAHDYLRVAVDYDGIDSVDSDCFNLTLQRLAAPGTEHIVDQEIYRYLSVSIDHPNFVANALAGSKLMRADSEVPLDRPCITLNHGSGKAEYFRGVTQSGHAGARITMADVLGASDSRSGLFALSEQYDFGQLYIPPLDFNTDISVPVLRTAARMCDKRHAVLVADAPRSWDSVKKALEAVERYSLRGPNVALYYPWLELAEGMSKEAPRCVPPGGAVAGALERSALADGPSTTPAGRRMVLRGFRRFVDNVDERASFKLASNGINSLRNAKGGRKVIWDAVLLNDDSRSDAMTSLRVRRLMQYVARSLEQGLQWVELEEHSDYLWRKVQTRVSAFMESCLRRGWLAGNTPENAFRVQCDLGTNPGVLRQNGELGLTVELAPLLPSRFVKLSVVVPTAGNAHYG